MIYASIGAFRTYNHTYEDTYDYHSFYYIYMMIITYLYYAYVTSCTYTYLL